MRNSATFVRCAPKLVGVRRTQLEQICAFHCPDVLLVLIPTRNDFTAIHLIPKNILVTWHFAVRMFATVIQKETLKSPKFSTLEESEIEAYRIPELG